ncbi:MAG: DALR domain-containing protein, partial [Candidatus Peregrinibacteria bacterium]
FTESKHGNQDMQWDSPWGRGFPGWHIECSAMSVKYLGKQFDIHCGGIDHISVHHTNEIAQAEGALKKKPWVRFWMHGNFLVISPVIPSASEESPQNKMSKSGDNFITLQTLIEKGCHPLDYRYFCLQAHYRKELTFSWKGLDAAKVARRRLQLRVQELGEKEGDVDQKALDQFMAALDDDLNIPQALAVAWDLMDDAKIKPEDRLATILKFDSVLGLRLDEPVEFNIPPTMSKLLMERNKARKNKDWKKSDELRAEIEKLGFKILDRGGSYEVQPL